MDSIRIDLHRHLITLSFEVLYIMFCLLCCLPGVLLNHYGVFYPTFFVVYCVLVFGLYVFFAIKKGRWLFPVSLFIREDRIDIECRPFFFFYKKYCWQKKDVTIIHYAEVLKMSSITFSNNNQGVCILFESIALKKELMNNIICMLNANGYEIVQKRKTE